MAHQTIEGFQISPQQSLLWKLCESGGSYISSCSIAIQGSIDTDVLKSALQRIVDENSIFRTSFYQTGSRELPLQVISEQAAIEWKEIDISGFSTDAKQEKLGEILNAERAHHFQFASSSLLRVCLVRTGPDNHRLLLTLPALCADSDTLDCLFRLVVESYSALVDGGIPESNRTQYLQVSEWLNELMEGRETQEEQQPDNRTFTLPGQAQPLKGSPFLVAVAEFQTDASLLRKIKFLAEQFSASPQAVWMALWQVTLWKLSGELRLTIGHGCAGRKYEELQDVPGPCFRVLPVSASLHPDYQFAEVLALTSTEIANAESEQEYFSRKQVEAGETPFTACFEFQPWPGAEIRAGVSFLMHSRFSCSSPFLVKAVVVQSEEACRLELHYDQDCFSSESVRILGRCLLALAESALDHPEAKIGALSVLNSDDRRRAVVDWNQTRQDSPRDVLVHELISRAASRAEHQTAVEYGSEALTFAQLERRSTQLAHYLQAHGVGADEPVGILMDRSIELLVATLAVLKAGGAYLPLSPFDPQERIALILNDAAPGVVLTNGNRGAIEGVTARIVNLDRQSEEINKERKVTPQPVTLPENLAYIIYTSGSTGIPKGVQVTHAGLLNYLHWAGKYYKVAEGNGAALHSDINFDMTVTSLFAPLIAGKKVLIVPERKGPDGLYELLRSKENLSFIKLTPSHLDLFNPQLQNDDISGAAGALIVGGEALMAESLALWRARSPRTRIINEYGPTEAVVGCCIYEVGEDLPANGSVPIGRPIDNTQLYILDESYGPAPIGAMGELYIGGAGIARGYLNRFDLTAERFVPNPFSPIPGERLYKTGDLARYRHDGTIEYAGRTDSQVKVHGHRVESGEVEAALRRHREVRDAAVITWGGSIEKQLIAYLVVNARPGPSSRELRQFLLERLPEYMVPARYIVIDRMPLTPSGKIDRKALPNPGPVNTLTMDVPYAPPQTLAQEVLASIWSEVLALEQVGIDDNFFVLGGDSIRAIQVRARAQKRDLQISQQQLFELQTIRELAQVAAFGNADAGEDALTGPFSLISEEERQKLPADIEDAYPLTHLQKGMLFHAELNPESAVYHDLHSFHLRIPFDNKALDAAIQDLAQQHEVLRTSFDLTSYSQPLQVVHRRVKIELEITDLRHLTGEALQAALAEAVEKQRQHRFLWNNAPLLRFAVQRRTDETIQFVMCFQHSIMDGWSAATLLTSLFNRYSALLRGFSEELPRLTTAFRDFVAAESKALASKEHHSFWEELTEGATAVKLPRSQSGTIQSTERRAHIFPVSISDQLSFDLQRLARASSVPVKSVLLAAHLRVMNLLAGRNDVTTGTVLSGRLAETDGDRVLGLFLNVMPLRLHLQGGSWQQLITETFEAERSMLPFRRFPLAELQRIRGGQELFETACNFMHYHVYRNVERMSDAQLLDYSGYEETNFAFVANFSVEPASPRIHLQFNYLPTEFSQERIEIIGGYYVRALQAMAANPEADYANVHLLSEPEERWLSEHSGGFKPADAKFESVAALFEHLATRAPNAVALTYKGQSWTYQELDQEANQLAHYLQNLGVGPDTIVGISVDRSANLVKGLLAILKAGGAYLPLDANLPAERLDYIIKDTGMLVVLTGKSEQWKLASAGVLGRMQVINLDSDGEAISQESTERLPQRATRDNLAYAMYTSGSTGHPKGVAITHGNILRLVYQAQFANLDARQSIAQFAPVSFDASTLEIWGSLLNGGRLVVFPGDLSSFAEFGSFLQKNEITTLWLTAGLFHKIVEDELHVLAPIRQLLAGGDVLSPAAVGTVLQLLPDCEVINGYGPTETTTFACCFNARSAQWETNVPIGKPINLTEVYVLDEHIQQAPAGVVGELYIGGEGLGRGYLNRPDLTAERFVPDPFSQHPGERLYRTGDLVKYREDGNLEFCGRADDQVKIRGFRIELPEIEAALLRQPQISEAAVIVSDQAGEKEIVAYMVLEQGTEATMLELREGLKNQLPEYMVPAKFIRLEKLPLTKNGKVDRAKLPQPDLDQLRQEQEYVPPQTGTEMVLAELWAEVLQVERVGVQDNLFALGGHSLIATQLISRIRGRFGIELPLVDLFDFPDIASFAPRVDQAIAARAGAPEIIPISRARNDQIVSRPTMDIDSLLAEIEGLSDETAQQMLEAPAHGAAVFPLSYSQEQIWNREQKKPGSFNIPLSIELKGKLHIPSLERSLNEIIRRHAALRTVIVQTNGHTGQIVSEKIRLESIPIVDLSGYSPEEAQRTARKLIREDSHTLFDLQKWPLFRVKLLRFNEEDHVALFTLHLIVSDAWSLNILMRELAILYPAFLAGASSPLEELPIQLVDYAQWERQKGFEREVSYWKQQLGGDFEAVELPLSQPRYADASSQGGSVSVSIDAPTVEKIRNFCLRHEITMFMFMVAAFKALLHEYTGKQEITLGIPESGRNRGEIEGLIGSFANTLVLRTPITAEISFTQLVQRVRKVVLESYEHRDMPYAKLLSMLGRGMPSEDNPLFRMMIDLVVGNNDVKAPPASLEVKTLEPEPESLVIGNDLTLLIKEQNSELEAALLYKTALFEKAWIRQVLNRFNVLVHKVLEYPEHLLSSFEHQSIDKQAV